MAQASTSSALVRPLLSLARPAAAKLKPSVSATRLYKSITTCNSNSTTTPKIVGTAPHSGRYTEIFSGPIRSHSHQGRNTPRQTRHTRPYSSVSATMPPSTMKAIQIARNGGPDVIEYKQDVPVPELGAGQVLVKNHVAGVNYIDTYFRTGLYKTVNFPLVLGREAAGEIAALGPSDSGDFKVGDRVVYMVGEIGSYAEYTPVSAEKVVKIPDALPYDIAAAAYLQGLTAWTFIREAANVQAGQWTLVHAAAGGVGSILVQLLRAVGAKVIGTASTEEKRKLAEKNGAEWTVDSRGDVAARVKEITGGHGVDAIFDGVGKTTFDMDIEMIAMKGNLISFGNASGAVDPVNILRLGPKNVRLMRPIVNGYVAERKDLEKYAGELFDLIISKKLELAIHEVYPLEDAARAHVDIESRKTTGKLLIKIV